MTMCYISSKLRAVKNNVVSHLQKVSEDEKEKIIEWAIPAARKNRVTNKQKHEQMKVELMSRIALKRQKIENKERKTIETQLKNLQIESVKKAFPNLEEKTHSHLIDVLSGSAVGRNICHNWLDEGGQPPTTYYGKIEKLKRKSQNPTYVVAYWALSESYDDAVDYDIPKFQLAADVICGDVILS
eukprot:TRINITY_DN35762_c1_g1_i1.p1 TRINITY_DN35762_c1_g1~~TRINITY_DN35762_c1_g1_i1.p1  ORF type:complete len:197 (-),score=40.14 TRINITY_DN35762_c1_g1_i1:71-625(-)